MCFIRESHVAQDGIKLYSMTLSLQRRKTVPACQLTAYGVTKTQPAAHSFGGFP